MAPASRSSAPMQGIVLFIGPCAGVTLAATSDGPGGGDGLCRGSWEHSRRSKGLVIATLVTRTITNVKGIPGGVAARGETPAHQPRGA